MEQSKVLSLFQSGDDFRLETPIADFHALRVSTTDVVQIPQLAKLKKGQQFSIFKKKHADEAAAVYNYLISCNSFDEFCKEATRLRTVLNEGIYLYAVSVALLHRSDSNGALMPPLWQINPKSYFPQSAIKAAFHLTRSSKDTPDGSATSAPAPFITGTNRDMEYKMAWWREDCGLNAHHYHWHQVYPCMGVKTSKESKPTTKDREGELFYHMHQQMLARYDADRLAVGLLRVEPYGNWKFPIPEGYNSHLTDYYGTHQYSARPSGMRLADNWTNPENPKLVDQQEYHYHRLLDAIHTGKYIKNDGTHQDVDIVSLGAAVEASISSPNPEIYGSVHNNGHDLIAVITDPDGRYRQAGGVMGDTATAVRDPIFFRWHKFIDDVFFLHKIKLTPYTKEELQFESITAVNTLQVQVSDGKAETNVLTTRMEDVSVDISHDMFLGEYEKVHTPVIVTVKQVNHNQFDYTINVTAKEAGKAAVRIFMAPSFDEHGSRYQLDTQRRMFIEMDKFVYQMKAGENNIIRSSDDSSVIKPPDLTFKQLKDRCDKLEKKEESDCRCLLNRFCEFLVSWFERFLVKAGENSIIRSSDDSSIIKPPDLTFKQLKGFCDKQEKKEESDCRCRLNRYCECGWPLHMLLPRGTHLGMQFDLFVMITDWAADSSTDDLDQGSSYCGVKNEKYPDSRAMGFPFDRVISDDFLGIQDEDRTVSKFTENFSNMKTVPIYIKWC